MAEMVAQMQQDQQQRQAQPETVTRNAPVDLLSGASAAIASAPKDEMARTIADRIRALVARSSDPLVSAAIALPISRCRSMEMQTRI